MVIFIITVIITLVMIIVIVITIIIISIIIIIPNVASPFPLKAVNTLLNHVIIE